MLTRTGLAAGDTDFAGRAVELAEEGARRNPGVATFEGIAQGLRGLLDDDLDRLAQAADTVTRSPPSARPGRHVPDTLSRPADACVITAPP